MITFSIDTFPLTNNILESNDYSSKVIYSAVCDTLFKYNLSKNRIVKNACNSYKYINNRNILIIKIRNDLYFSNGKKVTAEDYYRTLKKIKASKTHIGFIFNNFFSDVKLLDEMTLQLNNKNQNPESYKILSIYSTTCINEKCTSGPYYLKEQKEDYILLERNPFYRKKIHHKTANKIKFILTDGINDFDLFNKNNIQITNNTLCNVNNIDKYDYIKEENYIYLNLTFSMKLMNKKFQKMRKLICNIIDRDKILQLLNYKHNANYSFIVNDDYVKYQDTKKLSKLKCKNLTLGYNNFYPNDIVAKEIKRQLEEFGFKVNLIKNTFDIKNNCDLNIVLNHLEYISSDAFFNSSYFSVLLQKSIIYKIIFRLYNKTHKNYLLHIINKKILKINFKIPLLKMNSYYLKKNIYKSFNYIELNYEEL